MARLSEDLNISCFRKVLGGKILNSGATKKHLSLRDSDFERKGESMFIGVG